MVLLWLFGSVLALFLLAGAITILKENHFGPFATGTKNAAFLGTTFGMSPQETKRALKKEGAQLMNYAEYRSLDGTYETNLFDYLYPSKEEQQIHADLFMTSIELFDCSTEGRFVFRKDRLESVEIYFKTYTVSDAQKLIDNVKSHLLEVYPTVKTEANKFVPGAYYLRFASEESKATLWVNLTEATNLMVNLFLDDLKGQRERKNQLKQREEKAFRTAK